MLEDYWYIACSGRRLGRKPLAVRVFDRCLVLFRDRRSRPIALEDRCPHRNAPLSQGKVIAGTLRCPYHGWRFDARGRLLEIPSAPPGAHLPKGIHIKRFHCLEQDGYVWVCPGDNPVSERPFPFPYLGAPGWTSFRMSTRFHAPVEACLENFLDCPHAIFVHRHWFRAPTAKPVRAVTRTLTDGAITDYFQEPRERSLVWSTLSSQGATMHHSDRFIAPATSRVDYRFSNDRHYIITSSCTPIDRSQTQVHTVISFRRGRLGPLIRLFFEPLSRLIIRQDVRILDQQQANIRRFGKPAFTVVEQDVLFHHIADWRRALSKGTPPPPAGQEVHVDLRF